jgi:UrcA family protein
MIERATCRQLPGMSDSLCMLFLLWAQPGLAQVSTPNQNPTRLVVKYDDLDLARRAGVIELYRRIENAARVVCTSPDPAAPKPAPTDACLTDAVSRAVAEINQPALNRYFAAQKGHEQARAATQSNKQ